MKLKLKKILFAVVILTVALVACICIVLANKREKAIPDIYAFDEQNAESFTETDDICNILFMGLDNEAGLCDVMMLVGINKTSKTATAVQIPRDTYAAYTSASYKKLNGAYTSLGGARQTADFLENVFGIEIHHYACINLDTFGDIVDALGGVDIELARDMKYSDAEQGLYINLKKGKTHLDGATAKHFVRFRSGYADGDLGRIDAQKLFMASFFEKLANSFSPIVAAKLACVLEGVETDLGISDMLSLGAEILDMNADSIFMLTLPGKEATATQSGASYYVVSREACSQIFDKHFGAESEFDAEQQLLNKSYDIFENIYFEYAEYSLTPIADIIRNGAEFVT